MTTAGDGPVIMVGDIPITIGLTVGTTLITPGDGTTHGDTTVGDGPVTTAGAILIMAGDMPATGAVIMDMVVTMVIGTDPTTTIDTMAEIMPTCPEEGDTPAITVQV